VTAGLVAAALVAVGVRAVLIPADALGDARPALGGVAAPAHRTAPVAAPDHRTAPVAVRAVNLPDPCPLKRTADHPGIKGLIVCEAGLWSVPGGASEALAVAHCESRFEVAAFNPSGCGGSGCDGLYQQSLRYWRQRAASYGYAGRPATDPRANIVVSMRMAAERGTWSRDWPVCGR